MEKHGVEIIRNNGPNTSRPGNKPVPPLQSLDMWVPSSLIDVDGLVLSSAFRALVGDAASLERTTGGGITLSAFAASAFFDDLVFAMVEFGSCCRTTTVRALDGNQKKSVWPRQVALHSCTSNFTSVVNMHVQYRSQDLKKKQKNSIT